MDAIMVSKTQIQQEHFQQNLFERFINYTDVKILLLKDIRFASVSLLTG